MKQSPEVKNILAQINTTTKLGDLRIIAKEIKTNHQLALELWSTKEFSPRQLAILIMDKKLLSSDFINNLVKDMQDHPLSEQIHLIDWLMSNQLTKDKRGIQLIENWQNSPLSLQRRLFWYYQARLRWMGQTPPLSNTGELLSTIEKNILKEVPEVQWAMNFVAGWIGIFDKQYRERCINLGNTTGLYKGEMVSKGCTPNYLPEFITIESKKRKL